MTSVPVAYLEEVATIYVPVTWENVLELAREAGYAVEERSIRLEELAHADEVFFTGTTTEVRPTVAIDGRPVADGRVGPVARALFHAFLDGVEDVAAAALPG